MNKHTLKRILSLLKPHWKTVILFIFAIVVVSALDSIFTYLSKQIIDLGINLKNEQELIRIITIYGSFILVQAAGVFLFVYTVGLLGERIRYDLRKKLFNHLQKLSLSYFSQTPVGWIMARVTSDTERVAELMTWGLLDSTWALVNILTSTYFMILINWKLAIIVLVSLPIMVLLAIKFRKHILLHYRRSRRYNSRITASLNENITGVRIVKALSREDTNLVEFKELSTKMYTSSFRAAYLSALFLPAIQTISAISLGVILWRGGLQVQSGDITIGGIQAFISYIMFILWPIQDLARVFADMQNAIASAERIFSLAETEPSVKNRHTTLDIDSISGDIVFDHVDFYYEKDDPVIKDLSFSVEQGQSIALVGPTGGGKSTIVNLLCRFYEPTSGTIKIAGVDYHELKMQDIQSRIGVVLQTPHLFTGSIMENIRYGKLSATDEEIKNAAKLAGAHTFIEHFEKGYDQNVGEGGNLLSVGQKQLISIARAILADPEVFVMDEATSSVDTLTEALIQQGMEELMKERTSFIIAHRLSTIKRADIIMVIDDGQISEMGTHEVLMRLKGHYFKLYTQQFRQELESKYDPFQEQAINKSDQVEISKNGEE
ncbi:MAG: ABC transporter ATP-binding protein/permease [Anaerolineaceae bacterium]|nr:ABC transporter ATP-binding protein/permease [Anaerolineaceae bacterium]